MGLRDSQCDVLRRLVTHWRRLCSYRWSSTCGKCTLCDDCHHVVSGGAVDFIGRLMSVLADGVLVRGIVTLQWSVLKEPF